MLKLCMYVINGAEFVAFGDPSNAGYTREFYLQEPASSSQRHRSGCHELFFALLDDARPADNERSAGS